MVLALEKKNLFTSRSDRVKCVDFHPTEPWVLVSLYSGHVNIWNYHSQTLVKTIEVCDSPVRTARFIGRKGWIITGSDDLTIRVFNYHTLEKVAFFDGHGDYIRNLAVHPTRPYVLSSSDDMTVKLWDWEKGWKCTQTFEGHQHYVMDVAFNPKDPNTFATASLDRSIKIWSLSSPKANYSLEGHEKGVNNLAYYPGADRPYLVSGADDNTVRVWDYQNKSCVRVLEGHTMNVSSVLFHPELPLIISGSEDCTLKVWNVNTFRLETSYSMSLERIWALASSPAGTNEFAIGCDDGILVLQLGKGEPTASMDANGKVIWARHHEILTSNVKTIPDLSSLPDGERLQVAGKELGQCELFPQSLQHSPNGRFVAVCGDGEYIIYTAVAWRNRAFGKGLDFAWAASSNEYCVKETSGSLSIYSNFNESGTIRLGGVDRLFGGVLLGVSCAGAQLCFYDWNSLALLRRIDVDAVSVNWCETTNRFAITTKDSVYLLQYHPDVAQTYLQQGHPIPEDGIEEAFEIIDEVTEAISSALWVQGCFVFVNVNGRLAYHVPGAGEGQTCQLAIHDRQLFLLGFLAEESRLILTDKDNNLIAYSLAMSVIAYEAAILAGDSQRATSLLASIPADQKNRVAHFLEAQGKVNEAFDLATDADYRFDLALRLNRLENAFQIVNSSPSAASDLKWRQLGDKALADWKIGLAEKCFWQGHDLTSLLLLYTASANSSGLVKLAKAALEEGQSNIAFTCYFSTGQVQQCYDLLIESGQHSDAALFARTYLPSKAGEAVAKWKEDLSADGASHIELRLAESLVVAPVAFDIDAEPSAPVSVPSGQSSAYRPRNVSFDKSIEEVPFGSLPQTVTSVLTNNSAFASEHMSLEVNTTGSASTRAALTDNDPDELASLRTFATGATAGALELDRLTIHDEAVEFADREDDLMDDERNPRPKENLFNTDPAPPAPSFHYTGGTLVKEDEDADVEPKGKPVETAKSPLQSINLKPADDDWL